MSDPTQFIVSLPVAHRLLIHQGILATGWDHLIQIPCLLHTYTDIYKRSYVMQQFDNLDSDTVSNKLSSIAKYSHSAFLPNIVKPLCMATRKTQKTSFELSVFYETTGIGEMTLQSLIAAKKSHGQKFQPEQITAFFWQMADFLFLSARNSSEYLDLSPLNILCKIDGYYGYNFFITNFCRKYAGKNKCYYNPKDKFFNGIRTLQARLSSAMFTLGLILLEISCLLPISELFEDGIINQKVMNKRIEGITITNDKMISSAIKQLLQIDQNLRLKPGDIFKNDEWLKLRKVMYFQSKPDFYGYKNFQGVVEYDKKTSIGESLDQNLCMLRGTFINGIFEGRGVRQIKDSLQIGVFLDGQFIEGQSIKKNSHIDSGKFKNGKIYQGFRIFLNVISPNKQVKTIQGFIGQFEDGQPKSGKRIFTDGSESEI